MQLSDELTSLAVRDPLSFGITYVDLLEGRPWEVETRAWTVEPYKTINPWLIEKYPVGHARTMSVMKSTQSGVSTMGLVKLFHFMTNWDVRVFYTLPRQQDTIDMVGTRVDPMVHNSPYLRERKGLPDSTHAKRIGNSYVFFMELSVEPRMQPADMLIVDEVDLSDPDYMSTAQNRLDASRWKLQLFLSTPTVSNWGIHNMYTHSDQRKWMVKCPKCNHFQWMDWDQNMRVVGNPSEPDDVFYGCSKCDARISVEHIQTGEWVAQKPSMSDEHVGFHISQMMTTDADILWKLWRDPQTKTLEFYRKRLGMPYEVGGGSVTREDFLVNAFTDPYEEELVRTDKSSNYYMGVDQGNELQVLVGRIEHDNPDIMKIVHAELVEPIAPDGKDSNNYGFARVAKLMRVYGVSRCVIDGDPNRHEALKLQQDYPGRMIIADYAEQKDKVKKKKAPKSTIITNVTINRTTGFDDLLDRVKRGQLHLYGNATRLHQEVELVIDQMTAIKRDVEMRRVRAGEIEVAVYRKVRADHFAHSGLYLITAGDLDKAGKGRVEVINSEKPDEDEAERAWLDMIMVIVGHLAEVPKEQLAYYVQHIDDKNKELPFPLSHKIKFVAEYDQAAILAAIKALI